MSEQSHIEEIWRKLLTGELIPWARHRRLFQLLPASREHRCKNCNAPLKGIGAYIARLAGRRVYNRNPRFCDF